MSTVNTVLKVMLIVVLCIIAYLIYLSWVALTNLSLFTGIGSPPSAESEGDLSGAVSQLNDFAKSIMSIFMG